MDLPGNKKHWDGPGLDAWRPWSPQEVADWLAGIAIPWHVVGGWAIDLWLDAATRNHHDIEIAIPLADFAAVRDRLRAFRLHVAGGGEMRQLSEGRTPPADRQQIWVLDEAANAWRMDIMLEPGDPRTWVFRRDERIRAPRAQMVGVSRGIPYLKPEGVLLFKAKASREKDETDFNVCLPRLGAEAVAWLRDALAIAHPRHPWIARLGGTPPP